MSIRLGGALRELRIHLCQTSQQSAGVREFIQKNYVAIKKENPKFPILIRECSGVQPRVWARYDRGFEVNESLADMSSEQVMMVIKKITKNKCNLTLNKINSRLASTEFFSYYSLLKNRVVRLNSWNNILKKGAERSIPLTNLSSSDVLAAVKQLVK